MLEYRVCSACGRNEYVALRINGRVVATGVEAQREFIAMEEVDQPAAPEAATIKAEAGPPVAVKPLGSGLVRVRFITGGDFIERPSFFADRWSLIESWQPYDNGPALEAAKNPPPIPPDMRVGSPTPEPKHVARPIPPPPPQEVPRGTTLSLF